jgi:hypothetical protein
VRKGILFKDLLVLLLLSLEFEHSFLAQDTLGHFSGVLSGHRYVSKHLTLDFCLRGLGFLALDPAFGSVELLYFTLTTDTCLLLQELEFFELFPGLLLELSGFILDCFGMLHSDAFQATFHLSKAGVGL